VAVEHTLNFLGENVSRELPHHRYAIWPSRSASCRSRGLRPLGIQFSAGRGRRRVSRFVDAMDYLHDGLLATDRKGRITGSNPAARNIAGTDITSMPGSGVFPSWQSRMSTCC